MSNKKKTTDQDFESALPREAVYFDSFRTNAYMNKNLTRDFIDFYVAIKTHENTEEVDGPANEGGITWPRAKKSGVWRVMHYLIFDLDKEDGIFKSEIDKDNLSFLEAMNRLATHEEGLKYIASNELVDLSCDKYPEENFPELKEHYFDIEHYRLAGSIEGITFDHTGTPHKRLQGKIISHASFKRSEIKKPIDQEGLARENPSVLRRIETGFLADVFNSSSNDKVSLDHRLKAMETLSYLDDFAVNIGAFYLGTQKVLGIKESFDDIQSLKPKEKESLLEESFTVLGSCYDNNEVLSFTMPNILSSAEENIIELQNRGVHVEPFQKLVAECNLFLDLLSASKTLENLNNSLSTSGKIDRSAIDDIKRSVNEAQDKFMKLGGSDNEVDRLKAWVADSRKDSTPTWLGSFIDRFYSVRKNVAKRLQEKQNTAPREVKTLAAKVNPPSID